MSWQQRQRIWNRLSKLCGVCVCACALCVHACACVCVCVRCELLLPKKSTAESCDYHMICMML